MTRRYGAGTVFPLPNGRYCGQASMGRDAYGNRVRVTVTADSEAAAWKALATARSSSGNRRRGGESVAAFLDRWLEDVVRRRRRERTYIGYRQIVEQHILPTLGDRPLRALSRGEVQAWADRMTGSPLSVKHRADCLRAALGQAVDWELIPANPAARVILPATPKHFVRALSPKDAQAIIDAATGTWFAPLVTVALYTGLRQGELLGLQWADVDLAKGTLTVNHSLARLPGPNGIRYELGEPKTEESRRTVPLVRPALEALRAHRKASFGSNEHGLVFSRPDGRPIDGTALTHEFQAALKARKRPTMRWHDLRHGTASLLIAQGVPLPVVSAILGHSGIAITVDTYGHLTEGTKRAALDGMAENMAVSR